MKLNIHEAISTKAEELLKNGEVELVIVNPMLIESEPYNVISLLREHFYVIVEENSPLFLKKSLKIHDPSGMKVALPRAYVKTVLEYCRMGGVSIHISVLTSSTISAICFVLMKGVYAIAPLGEQERIVPKTKVRRLDFEGFNTVGRKIIWRKDFEISMNAKTS